MSSTVSGSALDARTHSHGWALTAAGALAMGGAFATLALSDSTVVSLVAEDGVVEWIGSIGLFAAAALFLACFVLARRDGGQAGGLSRLGVWMLLALAVLMFAAGGEEISWGQRLFGWATPETISDTNVQGETNLHNLTPFEGAAIGDRVFKLSWIGLFVLVPLLAWVSARARTWLSRLVPIVPVGLTVLFVLSFVLAEAATIAFDGSYADPLLLEHAVTEIWECVVEVLAVFAALAAFMTLRRPRAV